MLIRLNAKDVAAEQCRRSLFRFAKRFWPVVEPGIPFVANWHHEAIAEHLEAVTAGSIKQLLINMPPRELKSTFVSVLWPAWEWASNPHTKWLYGSYAMSLAIRDSVKTRRLILSPQYQELYGAGYNLLDDQNQKVKFENNKLGYRLCTAVDASTTGEGGDRLVLDDPHNVLEAYSEAVRTSTLTWVREGWSTRVNDRKLSTKTVVMQRVHAEDVSAHFLAEGGWEHLCLPNEFEEALRKVTGIGWTDPRTAEGELLNPARLGPEELPKVKKELGSLGYSGQMQQRPTPAAGGFFKRSWWGYYGKGTNKPLPARFDLLIGSWDCAFKDKPKSDYVVGGIIGYKAPYFYLLEVIRDKLDYPATRKEVELQMGRWPSAHAILIEDKANGPAVISELKLKFGRLIPVNPEGGKMARAAAASPVIECGEFLLPAPAEGRLWVTDFVDECAAFPLGTYDDQVDMMTQGVIWIRSKLGLKVVTHGQLKEARNR